MRRGRFLIAVLLTLGLLLVQSSAPVRAAGTAGTAVMNCNSDGTNWTCTWNTHGRYAWTVPNGVSSMTVDVRGASGGVGSGSQVSLVPGGGGSGGNGGEVQGTLPVTPGTVLTLQVGGAGGDAVAGVPGFQSGQAGRAGYGGGGSGAGIPDIEANSFGGGGGGASLIATSASSPVDLVVGAGGGGGSGETYFTSGWAGGSAGYPSGGSGASAATYSPWIGDCHWGAGGDGGTQSAGGAGGAGGADGGYSCPNSSLNGGAGSAGTGGNAATHYIGGGGGGGGYYGGGGGGAGEQAGGGGGGSSYADQSITDVATSTLSKPGDGSITITYPGIATHTTVTSSANPSNYESPVTFTATVDQPNAAGMMQFQVDGTNVGSPAPVTGGVATSTNATLDVGNHTITAVYSGDPTSASMSSSGTVNQTVTAATSNLVTTSWSTPGTYSWTVPNGVDWVTADARGASGGRGSGNFFGSMSGSGGHGGDVQATLRVTPGQVLTVQVGGAGGNGIVYPGSAGAGGYGSGGSGGGTAGFYNAAFGGGGGGASLIATTDATPVTLLIGAGGGGGTGSQSYEDGQPGGDAGYPAGSRGATAGNYYGGGGGGGTQTAGGSGGTNGGYQAGAGAMGSLGAGGTGNSGATSGGGGGGGGYYGGGGGGAGAEAGGGGGGSSHADASLTDAIFSTSSQSGNGTVSLSYVRAQAATSLMVSSTSGTYGGTTTLSATLTSDGTGVGGKTVTFSLNGKAVCGGSGQSACPTTGSNGIATLSDASLAGLNAGIDTGAVGASFAGDNSYSDSTASSDLSVSQAAQSITFNALTSVTYGVAPFTVNATGGGSTRPVTFSATGNCSSSGTNGATITVTGAGSCTVTASQLGDSNYTAATSVSQTFSIAKASATITLDAGSLSATYDGNPHLATATTTPSGLSYSVSYTDAAGNAVNSPTNAGSYGVAVSVTDPNYQGNTSGTLVIARAATTTTVASSVSPSTVGQSVTFTATVEPATGSAIPSGSITFTDGSTTLGTGMLSGGTATFTTSGLSLGGHTITASYAGDSNYQGSTSAATIQNVDTSLMSYPTLSSGAYNLTGVGLAGAYLAGSNLAGATITSANLSGANLGGANLAGTNLTSATLSNANLTGASLKGANLSSANLTNANLGRADLTNANLTKTNLKGATGLRTATLIGVIWSKTTCPDNTLSTNDGGTCVGHL